MASAGQVTNSIQNTESGKNYTVALAVLTTLFFMWGVIAVMNDILIPYLKKIFELSRAESLNVTAYLCPQNRDSDINLSPE